MKINQLTEQEWALTMQIVKDAVENGFHVEVEPENITIRNYNVEDDCLHNSAEYGIFAGKEEDTTVTLENLADIAKTGRFVTIQG